MKLFTVVVYNWRMCTKEDNLGPKISREIIFAVRGDAL